MRSDPIIEEVHAIRQQLMREAGGKLSVAIERAHQVGMQFRAQHKAKVIVGTPRRPVGWGAEPASTAPAEQSRVAKKPKVSRPRTG